MLNVYSLCLEFTFDILIALMLNEVKNKYCKSIVQTASFIPYFIAIVVATGITVNVLSPSTGAVSYTHLDVYKRQEDMNGHSLLVK